MVEYIDQRINHLEWQITSKSADITASDCCGDHVISGSKTCVTVWKFIDTPSGTYEQLPIVDAAIEYTPVSVCKVHLIGNIAFVALSDGTVNLYELVTERNDRKLLKLISKSNDLHGKFKCNDMLFCAQTNSVITCGNDGAISSFNIEYPHKVNSNKISDSSLKCMDILTPNEVICGTLSGSLLQIDLRTHECVGTFANQNLSALLCLQRNPNVNHLAIGGNDQGSIMIYDLRNQESALAQISAHSAAITNMRYKPKDSRVLYSSSCEGELFRWNLNTEFTTSHIPRKVESIGCTSGPLSITSFDVNNLGDMIYTDDHGAIFYHKLVEFVP